jgi:hypothetical protein
MHNRAGHTALAEQINSNGFRRWHEYELTRSFGYLGLGMLCLLLALAVLEGVFDPVRASERWLRVTISFAGICAALWSWRRFIAMLATAETLSRQAVCAQCRRYGHITVLDERWEKTLTDRIITCRCNKCGHLWSATYTEEFRRARI